LSRIASESSAEIVSTQRGGSSKDVWVLAPLPQTQSQTQTSTQSQAQRQAFHTPSVAPNVLAAQKSVGKAITRHDELASRLGENLFWLGRYTERCEGKARLLRITLAARSQTEAWAAAVAISRYMGVIAGDDFTADTYFDADNPLGLPADVQRLAWCATQSRSHLSAEHWRTINLLKRQLQDATTTPVEQREALDRLLLTVMALAGFVLDDMARDDGWRLLMLGRHLERLQFQCDLLRLRIAGDSVPTQTDLEWLLGINGSTVAYRARYMSAPRLAPTLELLIKDEENSRSLAFQHKTIRSVSAAISTSLHAPVDNALDEPLRAMCEIDLGALEGEGRGAIYARSVMNDALVSVAEAAGQMGERLSHRYFAHVRSELQVTEA
jgi:uncharacterized alpha-E superfamily protein